MQIKWLQKNPSKIQISTGMGGGEVETQEKRGGRCPGRWEKRSTKGDSQCGGKQKEQGKIMQHRTINFAIKKAQRGGSQHNYGGKREV